MDGSPQAPLSMARILEWVAIFLLQGNLPNPGIEPTSLASPAWQIGSLPLVPPGKPEVLVSELPRILNLVKYNKNHPSRVSRRLVWDVLA